MLTIMHKATGFNLRSDVNPHARCNWKGGGVPAADAVASTGE